MTQPPHQRQDSHCGASDSGGCDAKAIEEQQLRDRNRQLENALREKEQLLSTILNTALDAIVSIDDDGVIDSFNPAAEMMFGYSLDEVQGRSVDMLMPSVFRERHNRSLSDETETEAEADRRASIIGSSQELVAQRKDGTVFPISLSVGQDEIGHRFTGIICDLTQQRAMQHLLLQIAENTQRDIGQALHDDIGQEMTGLSLKAEALHQQLSELEGADLTFAANIIASLDRTRKKIRILSHGLIPAAVDGKGLSQALKALTEEIGGSYDLNCSLYIDTSIAIDDREVSTQLYHIAQEAIHNALRHSQGKQVEVALQRESRGLTLTIEDDGIGLVKANNLSNGSGLNTMQYRAGMIDALLSFTRSKWGGLKVICCLQNGENHARKAEGNRSPPL
ncbi:MAG: PAS domain S-box protein [Halopseudomonas sp.]